MFFFCRKLFLEGEKLASKQDGQDFEIPLSNKESWTHTWQAGGCWLPMRFRRELSWSGTCL